MAKNNFSLNFDTTEHLGIGLFKYALSAQEKFIFTNSTLAKILGFTSPSSLEKKTLSQLFLKPEDETVFFQAIKKQKKVKFFETIFKGKNNKPVWVAITACRIANDGKNKKEYLEGIIEDISRHKILDEQLSLEKDYLQNLLDNIPDAIYFKDNKNRIIKVNKFYLKGTGRKLEDVLGKTDFDFFPKDQAQMMFEDDNSVLKTGKPIVGKIERTILANGSWNQVITTKIAIYNKQGKIIGTMGITRDMTEYANLEKERLDMLINGLAVLVKALEKRDPYTFSHARHVAYISEKIGELLGWDENRLLGLKLAAEIHDLGKISIPLDILNKPGKLSSLEYQMVQEHVDNCYCLIKDIKFPFSLADIIRQHHERLDGSGYPQGLKADKILPEARILAVSDVLESMTHHRPYRKALGLNKAMEELERGRGSIYDSEIVGLTVGLVKENNHSAFWDKSIDKEE